MIPVDMLHLDHGKPDAEYGDCMRACVASLFELPPEDVPHFCSKDYVNTWVQCVNEWASKRGYFFTQIETIPLWSLTRNLGDIYLMAGGKSPRGDWGHWVINKLSRDGSHLFHDPHPSRAGLVGEPEDYGVFIRLDNILRLGK